MTDLTLRSDLMFGKAGSNYTFQGTQNWKGIILVWPFGCGSPSDPGYEACIHHEYTTAQIGDVMLKDTLNQVVAGKFIAHLVDFNKISIDPHSLRFDE